MQKAAVIALAGSSFAAAAITGAGIKNGTVTSADIKNGTIRVADIAPDSRGYRSVIARHSTSVSLPDGGFGQAYIACAAGEVPVGGGGGASLIGDAFLQESFPTNDNLGNLPADGHPALGWWVLLQNPSGGVGDISVDSMVLCARK